MRRALLIAAASLGLIAAPAFAQEPPPAPDRPLPDAAQEARAQALFDDIRCVVCQHEAIADSPAVIAADMRQLVREQVAAGRTDGEIEQDLVRRYGDFVLFQPPVRFGTLLLWFGPVGLMAGVLVLLLLRSRGRRVEAAPLTVEEEARLADIVAAGDLRPDPDAKPSDD
ncbi:MAG: cytochrome c-type biogenesis protein CcmH [Brevundimonas sp.]|nr:cytochrome c-type biogenesis protein CcmH [Brevundimonas sp.]